MTHWIRPLKHSPCHELGFWDHCLTHHISEDARTASSIREALVILHKEHLTLDHNCWLEHTQTALDTQSKCRRIHWCITYSFWNILVYTGSDPIGMLRQSSFVGPCGFSSLVTQAQDRRHWMQHSQRKRTSKTFFFAVMRSNKEVAHLCLLVFFYRPAAVLLHLWHFKTSRRAVLDRTAVHHRTGRAPPAWWGRCLNQCSWTAGAHLKQQKTFRTYGRANDVSTKPGERCRFWTGVKTLTLVHCSNSLPFRYVRDENIH